MHVMLPKSYVNIARNLSSTSSRYRIYYIKKCLDLFPICSGSCIHAAYRKWVHRFLKRFCNEKFTDSVCHLIEIFQSTIEQKTKSVQLSFWTCSNSEWIETLKKNIFVSLRPENGTRVSTHIKFSHHHSKDEMVAMIKDAIYTYRHALASWNCSTFPEYRKNILIIENRNVPHAISLLALGKEKEFIPACKTNRKSLIAKRARRWSR